MNKHDNPSQRHKLSDIRRSTEQLWAGVKYDIMARGYRYYKEITTQFGQAESLADYEQIRVALSDIQHRIPYSQAGLRTSMQHMWGYVSKKVSQEERAHYEALTQGWQHIPYREAHYSASYLPEAFLPVVQWLALIADQYKVSYLQNTFKYGFLGRTSQ
ncbi:DUF1722 domain-containing protein [Paenibacillus sp. UMB4589-SE434]|uniref:DUF1722 domain-containing protein n=1 Tax=Paenibacillus sp. UMB4589-SE434 TaxID=3046314 RepID=UPI00254D4F30|nr:DUF1722 domain-containing protein [Paenibacillus sp. UMB4589-SE434]MDK8181507.1 DUF1722 domain-containing protein [Paenibacillus sp. UMB4589-SE434]